jgi:hypothetical protein
MVAVQRQNGCAREMNALPIDTNDGAPVPVELVEAFAEAGELLVYEPAFELLYSCYLFIRLPKTDLKW